MRGKGRRFQPTHGMTGSPEYVTWQGMVARCTRPNVRNYPLYGGRGIKVCDRWRTFANFVADMGLKPSRSHSLDRIDNDLDYCRENCRWATPKQQSRNRRVNKLTEQMVVSIKARVAAGEKQIAIARELGVSYMTVHYAVRGRNWAPDEVAA